MGKKSVGKSTRSLRSSLLWQTPRVRIFWVHRFPSRMCCSCRCTTSSKALGRISAVSNLSRVTLQHIHGRHVCNHGAKRWSNESLSKNSHWGMKTTSKHTVVTLEPVVFQNLVSNGSLFSPSFSCARELALIILDISC